MPGLIAFNNVTYDNITALTNFTSPPQFFVLVNQLVFNGWLWFTLLWVVWVVLFLSSMRRNEAPMRDSLYAFAIVTIISFFLRGISALISGVRYALLSDHQLWVFPILTVIFAIIVWSTQD